MQWIAMQSSCNGEISKIKQGLEDMFGFSGKLVLGLNSASSCYEKKTESELTASNPACKSRLYTGSGVPHKAGTSSETYLSLGLEQGNQAAIIERGS